MGQVFGHNNVEHLEALLRTSIAEGQPRTHRPWRKIMIIVEGIYSMEGDICDLPAIVELKKRYKVRLTFPTAHCNGNTVVPFRYRTAAAVSVRQKLTFRCVAGVPLPG